MTFYHNSAEHLVDELQNINLLLQRRVTAHRGQAPASSGLAASKGVYITNEEVETFFHSTHHGDTERNDLEEHSHRETLNDAIAARLAASADVGIVLPLPRLAQLFSLSRFETQTLVICLAPELRRTYDTLYAYLQDDITRKRPSVDLVLQVLCSSEAERWQMRPAAFSDQSPLFRHGILRRIEDSGSPSGSSGLSQFLQIDQRILHYLLEGDAPDARLAAYATVVHPATASDELSVDPMLKASVTNLCRRLTRPVSGPQPFVIYFQGPAGVGKRDLVLQLCAEWGCPLLHIDMELLLAREPDVATVLRLAFREALLLDAAMYVAVGDLPLHEGDRFRVWAKLLAQMVDEYGSLTLVAGEHPWPRLGTLDQTAICVVEVPMPDVSVREAAWERALKRLPSNGAESGKANWRGSSG